MKSRRPYFNYAPVSIDYKILSVCSQPLRRPPIIGSCRDQEIDLSPRGSNKTPCCLQRDTHKIWGSCTWATSCIAGAALAQTVHLGDSENIQVCIAIGIILRAKKESLERSDLIYISFRAPKLAGFGMMK